MKIRFWNKVYSRCILSEGIPVDRCRAFHTHAKHLGHIQSGYPTYTKTTYIQRYNAALRILCHHLCHFYKIGLDFEKQTMFLMEFSASADKSIIVKEKEKEERNKYIVKVLRWLYPDYSVKLVVLIIGTLGDAKPSLARSLNRIQACQQKVVFGSIHVLKMDGAFAGLSYWVQYTYHDC